MDTRVFASACPCVLTTSPTHAFANLCAEHRGYSWAWWTRRHCYCRSSRRKGLCHWCMLIAFWYLGQQGYLVARVMHLHWGVHRAYLHRKQDDRATVQVMGAEMQSNLPPGGRCNAVQVVGAVMQFKWWALQFIWWHCIASGDSEQTEATMRQHPGRTWTLTDPS